MAGLQVTPYISNNILRVYIKPNSAKNEILGFDDHYNAVKIAIKAPAQDGKANQELLKFLTKQLDKKIIIKSGHTSKIKLLSILD